MEPIITSEIVVAYTQCPRMAYLLLFSPNEGEPHEYVRILKQQQRENQERYLDLLQQKHTDAQPYTVENLRNGSNVLINARLKDDGLEAECGILTKVKGNSALGRYIYEPTIFVGTYSLSKEQKLGLFFVGYVVERLQHQSPEAGRIVGMDGKSHTVKLDNNSKVILPLLEPMQEWIRATSPKPPSVVLNKHCPTCQFQRSCQTQAEQEDNLSLLNGVTARVMRQYERKGIFTVKQLSYLFKPRKQKKRSRKPPPTTHKVELQALAIRENKIYLQELPALSRQPVELFLDMEGVPDRQFHYLIGLLVCQTNTTEHYSFWADTDQDERHVWQQFIDKVNQYPDAPIYHYGSYEPRAIDHLAKRYDTDSTNLKDCLINVNSYIYGKVYFPVRSNRLKDIGNFIGATWTSPDASGLQSLVWRHYWDETQYAAYREIVVIYNREDCQALKLLTDEISKIKLSSDTLSNVDYADQRKQQLPEEGEQAHSQFKEILNFAHFGYNKKKISFRLEFDGKDKQDRSTIQRQKAEKKHQMLSNIRRRAKKIITIPPDEICPQCSYKPLKQAVSVSRRYIVDLVSTRNGLRKTVTQHVGTHGYCQKCQKYFAPAQIRRYKQNSVYGHGFRSWVVYQRIALRLPYESIIESLFEQFKERISISQPVKFLKKYANYYTETERSIMENMLKSSFIHADETKVNIKDTNWYVWVFTDERHVIFRLTETREATIVHEILSNYQGVLISDFYPGYDSLECRQQKCWVHLIRDLNDDLLTNPFDKEYEEFVLEVRNLIVPIMETIQRYGLKDEI